MTNKNNGYNEPKNLIVIVTPFDALTLYSALEYVEDKKGISRSLGQAIQEFKKQIEKHITNEQVEDAHAEFATRNLIGTY